MIVIDTSAIIALLAREPQADRIQTVMRTEAEVLISVATLAEALIVSRRRGLGRLVEILVNDHPIEIVPLAPDMAWRCADAYDRWGKGVHSAGLTYGDCFAYALARERDCPLLFVGNDFAQTDVKQAI